MIVPPSPVAPKSSWRETVPDLPVLADERLRIRHASQRTHTRAEAVEAEVVFHRVREPAESLHDVGICKQWDGEYAGKWIDASALMVGNLGNVALAAELDEMIKALIASQAPDGYLGIDTKPGADWDVWNIWYALTGLLRDY
jgi:hypothetical protein